jgi:hypothetical protein
MEFREMLLECPGCGWCHFPVTEAYVKDWEEDWQRLFEKNDERWLNAYGITKDPNYQPDERRLRYGPPTREEYLHCFRCGNPDRASFFESKKTLNGHTIQPILLTPQQEDMFRERAKSAPKTDISL